MSGKPALRTPSFSWGDSIKALQVSARLAAEGWDMTIRDLFQFPTIEELASHLTPAASIADQGPVEGNARLTPVQQRFLPTLALLNTITIMQSCSRVRKD